MLVRPMKFANEIRIQVIFNTKPDLVIKLFIHFSHLSTVLYLNLNFSFKKQALKTDRVCIYVQEYQFDTKLIMKPFHWHDYF
jgi:hypothetical protein